MGKRNLIKKTTAHKPFEGSSIIGSYVPVLYDAIDESSLDITKPLSKTEQKRRSELEGIISENFNAFLSVCYALREINQRMLYRNTHKRFSDYCKDMWEMARCRAYQLIDAANVVDNLRQINLSTTGRQNDASHEQDVLPIPQNERQARALTKFDPDQQRVIWLESVKTAPKGKISAAHIKKTARILHFEQVRKTIQKAKKNTNQAPKINEHFRRTFSDFLDAINIERASEYRDTDRKEVIRHVRIILDALEAEL